MYDYFPAPEISRRSLAERSLRRGWISLWSSINNTVLVVVTGWLPLLCPAAAHLVASRWSNLALGAVSVLSVFAFAFLLRARSRRPVSSPVIVVLGVAAVGALALLTLPPGGERIDFFLGGLAGGALSSAVHFACYTVSQVKREAMFR